MKKIILLIISIFWLIMVKAQKGFSTAYTSDSSNFSIVFDSVCLSKQNTDFTLDLSTIWTYSKGKQVKVIINGFIGRIDTTKKILCRFSIFGKDYSANIKAGSFEFIKLCPIADALKSRIIRVKVPALAQHPHTKLFIDVIDITANKH